MWFRPALALALVIAVSSSRFYKRDNNGTAADGNTNAGQGDGLPPGENLVDTSNSQKRWAFADNCVNDSNPCIDRVTDCCNDNSLCQKQTDGTMKCSLIKAGFSTCAALPMVAKCDYAGYDKNTPPAYALTGGQTKVNLQVSLKHIYKYPNNGLYNLDFHLVQYWNDPRLAHQENRLLIFHNNEQIDNIWRPDIFVSNAITAYRQDIPEPARSLRIFQDGLIRLSQRIQVTVPCVPGTNCTLVFESYGNIKDVMDFAWTTSPTEPLQADAAGTDTIVSAARSGQCQANYNTRTYPCLTAYFQLKP